MKIQITETVIEYHPDDLANWKRGEKAKFLSGISPAPEILNQPTHHFGEYFVLSYFKKAGWKGFHHYALGEWEPNNKKYDEGRQKIRESFSSQQLSILRKKRELIPCDKAGKGEPDLFLYMDKGPKLFLEVKKESDRKSPAQLRCLAQIKAILGAEIGVIYLAETWSQL